MKKLVLKTGITMSALFPKCKLKEIELLADLLDMPVDEAIGYVLIQYTGMMHVLSNHLSKTNN